NATASVAGSLVYNPALGTVLNAGTQTLNTTFTPNDTTDYTTATKSVNITVNKATPSVTVNSSNITSVYGQSVTFTANVAAVSPGGGTPTGNVAFKDGGTSGANITGCSSVALNNGSATCTTSTLSLASHTIAVVYSQTTNYNASNGTIAQVVV